MRDRSLTAETVEQFAVATRASLGVWRFTVRGERRAISRTLEPTERVIAVAGGPYKIVRQGAVAGRSWGALMVVTDRRLLLVTQIFPLRPARLVEMTRGELRDGVVEIDADNSRVVLVADAIRITMRPLLGRDAVDTLASSLGRPYRAEPDVEEASDERAAGEDASDKEAGEGHEYPHALRPPLEPAQLLGPRSRLQLEPLAQSGLYCLYQDDRAVASMHRLRHGMTLAARAGRRWRLLVRDARGGWIGVAEDLRTGELVASYRTAWFFGGTVTLEGREYRLRRRLGGAWRVREGGNDVAVLRDGYPRGDVELAAGVRQVADPLLLVVIIVWATELEGVGSSL